MSDSRIRLLVSGAIGMMLFGVTVYLWGSGHEIPHTLEVLDGAVWGFFTGHVANNGVH